MKCTFTTLTCLIDEEIEKCTYWYSNSKYPFTKTTRCELKLLAILEILLSSWIILSNFSNLKVIYKWKHKSIKQWIKFQEVRACPGNYWPRKFEFVGARKCERVVGNEGSNGPPEAGYCFRVGEEIRAQLGESAREDWV